MTITKEFSENVLTMTIGGKLDTATAPVLEKELDESMELAQSLILDLAALEYTSSAGLRVILKAQKTMQNKGGMKLKNVCDEVMDVFDITGFSDVLTIE